MKWGKRAVVDDAPATNVGWVVLFVVLIVGSLVVLFLPSGGGEKGRSGDGTPTTVAAAPTEIPSSMAPTPGAPTPGGPTATPSAPAGGATPDATGEPSVCGLAPGDQTIPSSTAPSASFRPIANLEAPVSVTAGPATFSGAIGTCYAHSPTGALFAAVNHLATIIELKQLQSPVAVVQAILSRGGDYATAEADAQKLEAGKAAGGPVPPGQDVKMLGYSYVSYDPTGHSAVISVAIGIGDPSVPSAYMPLLVPVTVVWEGGDWKFVYTSSLMLQAQPLINAQQYVKWVA